MPGAAGRWRESSVQYILMSVVRFYSVSWSRGSLRRICHIAIALLCIAGPRLARGQAPASAATPSYRHRILGVFDAQSGEPVEGAEVADALNHVSALTTRTGTVTLAFLPDGGSMLHVKKVGYQPQTVIVEIGPADTVPLTVILERLAMSSAGAQRLPAVVTKDSAPHYVSPGLRGFEERRRAGFGHFITEAELRKQDNRKLTDVLRGLPEVTMVCPKAGPRKFECYAVSGRGNKYAILGGDCEVNMYIDGVEVTDNDLDKLSVNQFAGIEFYSGGATIPVQYNKVGSSCGVLLFWTREQ